MAGLIIGVVGKKGGSGKTTVAVNLAGALAELFTEVLVIDADPQGTALTWRAAAGNTGFPVQVIGLPQAVIHQEAPKFAQKYDAIVIDSPSGYQDEQIQRSVMLASSLVVIPVQPSAVDIWSARDTAALVVQAKLYNPDLKAHLLVLPRPTTDPAVPGGPRSPGGPLPPGVSVRHQPAHRPGRSPALWQVNLALREQSRRRGVSLPGAGNLRGHACMEKKSLKEAIGIRPQDEFVRQGLSRDKSTNLQIDKSSKT